MLLITECSHLVPCPNVGTVDCSVFRQNEERIRKHSKKEKKKKKDKKKHKKKKHGHRRESEDGVTRPAVGPLPVMNSESSKSSYLSSNHSACSCQVFFAAVSSLKLLILFVFASDFCH
jgi:hypothetical protein